MATYLVTGCSRGIGLALVEQLAAQGEKVFAVSRGPVPHIAGDVRAFEGFDQEDPDMPAALAHALPRVHLDVAILNAGMLMSDGIDSVQRDEVLKLFEVNALAPLFLAQALLTRFVSGSKLGIVTSRMGSLGDNTSGGYYAYRMSKAALNMAAVSLAHDLRPRGVPVGLYHPGYVRTGMTGGAGEIEASEAAAGILRHLHTLTLEESGHYFHASHGGPLPY